MDLVAISMVSVDICTTEDKTITSLRSCIFFLSSNWGGRSLVINVNNDVLALWRFSV